ncbi:reverse transcriptase, partial [Phytophthora megakarya]
NNAVHASTGHTPFFVNAMRHPRLPSTLGAVASSLSGGDSTVASEQPQKIADTDLSAATTGASVRARTRQGGVSVPGTDTVKNHEQATPASAKDNVFVRCTDTAKTHAQASLLRAQVMYRYRASILRSFMHRLGLLRSYTTMSHAQSGTDATTSGEAVEDKWRVCAGHRRGQDQ